jgi:pantoate--beta-alanine ligase
VVDYTALRTPDLAEPADAPEQYAQPGPRVALIAAKLGRTRLIDNLEFELG